MERDREGIGSVKAAISLYGQKSNGRNKKDLPSKSGELQKAQMGVEKLKETKNSAEKERAEAELELFKAKNAAKELSIEIEKSNAKAMAPKLELCSSKIVDSDDRKYSELMQELSRMKQELSKLKLDVATALDSKAKAEKLIKDSNSKANYYICAAEEISKEINDANEEHVLVELARIEAERESKEIEAQRDDEAAKFSKEIEETKKKIENLRKETSQAKHLEMKLEATNSDLNVLQTEMELVRATERNLQKNKFNEVTQAELKAAKKELADIKDEAFTYMTSMDVIRKELLLISKETDQLSKREKKADATIQQLNSRLLKAKSKLEAAASAEERSEAIVLNLVSSLEQLQRETEDKKKEKEMNNEETRRTKLKIVLSETKICSAEEKLLAALLELEASKKSEAIALKKLRDVAERTMKSREQSSSVVTLSKSEYEYLAKRAESAEAVADKKVAAAKAWVEALNAEEKEILMRTEMVEKEIKNLKFEEENGVRKSAEPEYIDLQLPVSTPKVSMREHRNSMASARRAKARRSLVSSNIGLNARSPSFTIRKKRTAMPNLVKFLKRR